MKEKAFDLIEVVLKKELEIPLSSSEQKYLLNIDDIALEVVKTVIEESSYKDEVLRLINSILEESSSLPLEQRKNIENKCNQKKLQLEKTCSLS